MRVLIRGGAEREARLIAAALAGGGLVLADEATPFDLLLTLGDASERLVVGCLTIDFARHRVVRDERPVRLTRIEFALLAHLARARRPVPRVELLREIWGYRFDPGTNLVAVHMARLRAKIGGEALRWGPNGYALEPEKPAA